MKSTLVRAPDRQESLPRVSAGYRQECEACNKDSARCLPQDTTPLFFLHYTLEPLFAGIQFFCYQIILFSAGYLWLFASENSCEKHNFKWVGIQNRTRSREACFFASPIVSFLAKPPPRLSALSVCCCLCSPGLGIRQNPVPRIHT